MVYGLKLNFEYDIVNMKNNLRSENFIYTIFTESWGNVWWRGYSYYNLITCTFLKIWYKILEKQLCKI